jgi:hypothetical protein
VTRISARYTGHRPDAIVIRSVFRDQDGPVGRDLDARSRKVLARARVLVGVRSGTLLASGRREFGQTAFGPRYDVTFGVRGLTSYLGYHHDGSRPHIIRPRRRKALRFISGGQVVFATRVQHPGSAPNRFLIKALDAAR